MRRQHVVLLMSPLAYFVLNHSLSRCLPNRCHDLGAPVERTITLPCVIHCVVRNQRVTVERHNASRLAPLSQFMMRLFRTIPLDFVHSPRNPQSIPIGIASQIDAGARCVSVSSGHRALLFTDNQVLFDQNAER